MSDFVAHKEEYTTRLGRPDDYECIAAVELAAGKAFAEIDMAAIANDEPPMRAEIEARCEKDHLWVTVGPDDHVVAYLMIDVLQDTVHIEQVSVAPAHAGQRLGKGLIDNLLVWAKDRGLGSVTLTTFRDVPWNMPYYERLGFQRISEQDLSDDLLRIRRREAALGLDRWPRVCMVYELNAELGFGRDHAPN